MAENQKIVEYGVKDKVPFVIVEEGVYPNIKRTVYRGDLIPPKFQKAISKSEVEGVELANEEKSVVKKTEKEPQNQQVNDLLGLQEKSDPNNNIFPVELEV